MSADDSISAVVADDVHVGSRSIKRGNTARARRFTKEIAIFMFSLLCFLASLLFMQHHASQMTTIPDKVLSIGDFPAENRRAEATGVGSGGAASRTTAMHKSTTPGATSAMDESSKPSAMSKMRPEKPMNILLLYADDWRHDTLGAAGNPVVKTPYLDKLAEEGVRFTENCVTTSVCWCSRVTLYSGLYTSRHGTTRPKYWYVEWNATIYDMLQRAGYHVGHVGKWGVNHPNKKRVDFEVEEDGWHVTKRGGKTWHVTEKNEADALRFLEKRPKDKPFFVNVAFFATHAVDGDKRQYLPQNQSLSMYVDDVIPDPVTNTLDAYKRLPSFFGDRNEGRTRWRWRFDTPEKQQSMMKNYYRMASEVDSACGLIMKELELQGELNNTLIIFTTDNGNFHAEHGLADKWYPHQESIRVPLIIKDPRMAPGNIGTVNDDFTLNIDLAPTILSAAGIDPLEVMMGRDMSVLYRTKPDLETQHGSQTERVAKELSPWRTEFFYEHPQLFSDDFIPASEALVRKDYKYFYWPAFGWEQLFNLKDDPIEDSDMIDRNKTTNMTEENMAILNEMRGRFWELKNLIQKTKKPVTL
eukprot:CAMPEP_0197466644 /NCGR_PEP_ID=MMETSP1175-20131217/65162_1 /TAXON_ID=1003142 /ORGANISM="Triceratium dubium, Strain CCMP147" /LENGTH=583 /DNA_ID=CAMNT_0043002693 /DNA_START=359 /DNA_END=2110 /DNA_ORIENTATION=-